jgi:hypothetical protein
MAASTRIGSVTFNALLAAHVHVETTHGASSPSQLGPYHQRNGSLRLSTMILLYREWTNNAQSNV